MEVIEELIRLSKDLDAATNPGEDMGLTDVEIAFYDALAANHSAGQAMGDEKLKVTVAELITQVKKSVAFAWTLREGARAKITVMVKRILNKHGWLPAGFAARGREDRSGAGVESVEPRLVAPGAGKVREEQDADEPKLFHATVELRDAFERAKPRSREIARLLAGKS